MCYTSAIHYDGLTCKYESHKQNCLQETREQNTLLRKKKLLIILAVRNKSPVIVTEIFPQKEVNMVIF